MIMTLDGELLRRYSEDKSEEAFAELVRRHVDLVYSAALRQVNRDAHLAQDVTQMVFTELSRKAGVLASRPMLTGWLYTCAHFCAVKVVRTESRRHLREQKAQAMHELLQNAHPEHDWDQLLPVLDNVMIELSESDREAILMRYFENRQLSHVGEKLGLSEDAARKRVERALEKLRACLSRRGITTGASLAALLSANAVQMAPGGLATALAAATVAAAPLGTGATVTLLKLMSMGKLQAGIVSALLVGGIATPLCLQYQSRAELRQARAAFSVQSDQLAQETAENERLSNLVALANSARQLAPDQAADLLRLRNEVGALRRQTNDLAMVQAENKRLRAAVNAGTGSSTQTTPSQDYVNRESWTFAGYASPESAFQSAVWAMSNGDVKTYLAGLSPAGQEFKEAQDKSESELGARNKKELERVTAYKIIEKETVSDSEVMLTVYAQGENGTVRFRFHRIGNEWKMAGPVKGN